VNAIRPGSLPIRARRLPAKRKTDPASSESAAEVVAADRQARFAPVKEKTALSAEQDAKIWSMLRGEKAERLTNVEFSTTEKPAR
jgi:hypothetical protein